MNRLLVGLLVWLPSFLALELTAFFWRDCPWPTLSETVWLGIRWWHPVAVLVAVIMAILYGHFESRWPARYLIAAAIVGAAVILAHLVVRKVIL